MARSRAQSAKRDPDSASRRRAALLEVSLGRRCALACALAWATLAMLATLFYWRQGVISDSVGFLALFSFLLPFGPALAGLAVSGTAAMTKRGQLLGGHLKEAHNVAMFAGLGLSAAVLAAAVGIQSGSLDQSVGLYTAPLGVAGISLGLLGFLLTWSGWSTRKVGAVLCAVVPAALSGVHIFYPLSAVQLAVWEYMISGGLYLVAGVIFVVSMTATAAAEREIVRGADERVAGEYARLKALKKELDSAVARTSDRASKLEEDALDLEARKREGDDYALQANRLKEEAAALFARAAEADAKAVAKGADADGRVAAIEMKEKDLVALAARRAQEERDLVELRKASIQQKAEAEALRRKVDAERQAVAEQLGHAKREREAARATLEASQQKSREAEALHLEAGELRRTLDDQKQVLDARVSAVDGERLHALEQVQVKLSHEREALEKERALLGEERAKVARASEAMAEREAALATRAKEVDTVEGSLGEALSTLAKEKAEAEALKRQADATLQEAGDRTKSYSESFAKVTEREASAKQLAESLKGQEARIGEREKRIHDLEAELARRNQQIAAERKGIAGERERIQADAARLKEREEAIFHFEKHPEFAREAAASLAAELAIGPSAKAAPAPALPEAPAAPSEQSAAAAKSPGDGEVEGRLSLGNPRLNELLGGGLPEGSSVLVVGPAFCGKEAIPLGFAAAGMAIDQPTIIVTTVRSPAEIAEELGFMVSPPARKAIQAHVWFVDCSGKAAHGDIPKGHVIDVGSPADFPKIKEAVATHFRALQAQGHGHFRFAFLPLTESWRLAEPGAARTFVQQMVAAVRRQGGGAVWVAESGIHSADEIESLAGMMGGVVRLQEERDGHALRVQGFPGMKSLGWVRYKHSPKGIELGAFELERIR